ncbi:Uncharacterized protein Rs2_02641 [Raphanus sativus]|nr:Uncharacterized protein Rs2_02641 [Raphanus sativus]
MEKRRGERSGGCSESRLLGLIARLIYFPLQIYGGALMAAAHGLLRSFLLLEPSGPKVVRCFLEGVEHWSVVVALICRLVGEHSLVLVREGLRWPYQRRRVQELLVGVCR